MNRWRIGDVTITRIVELEATGGSRFILPDATPETVLAHRWLQPHFIDERGRLRMSVHALVVDTPAQRIMVDTCIGNDKERSIPAWSKLHGPFLDDLAAAGCPPDSIDTVVCTHLHVDHVGWNTMLVNGRWVPTFPKARYLTERTELAYWQSRQEDDDHHRSFADSVRPVLDAGLVDLVDADHRLCDEVSLVPTPGHTPGHVSVRIASRGEEALISGDFLHHPCQMARLDMRSSADHDPLRAARTRRDVFDRLAGTETLLFGTHFAAPSAGRVVRDGDAFALVV
ncbi:MAG TPA: MBL fold metallo-hydrolase [Candidatus Binatia bacterium]|nr:MBL fold metallo-hydrolase [Candidatus Binatia bacterium]